MNSPALKKGPEWNTLSAHNRYRLVEKAREEGNQSFCLYGFQRY